MGLDPAFGSSNFGVCITELVDGQVNIVHAEEYPRRDFNRMIETTVKLLRKYDITFNNSYPSIYDLEFLQQNMFVILVPFVKEHKRMLAHTKELMEYKNGPVCINLTFNKLVIALRTAIENGEGSLDKDGISHDDLFDSFRLSLMFWH